MKLFQTRKHIKKTRRSLIDFFFSIKQSTITLKYIEYKKNIKNRKIEKNKKVYFVRNLYDEKKRKSGRSMVAIGGEWRDGGK